MTSNYVNLRKISADDIHNDLVLSKNIYNKRGAILAHAGTSLTSKNYERLLSQGITSVDVEKISRNTSSIPEKKSQEFNSFKDTYEAQEKEVEDYLTKIGNGESIDIHMILDLTSNIIEKISNKSDLFLYLDFMKDFDDHTYSHCSNVALLSNIFGEWLGFNSTQLINLTAAGVLHDIGKIKIPIEILNKPSSLTPDEFEIMKKHTTYGFELLKSQNFPDEIKLAALMHHEKSDGSGYPLKIKDNEINYYAKIIAICDIYDAMTSNRVYRKKMCPFSVINAFEENVYGKLDIELLLIFLKNIANNYINSWVILSTGVEAEVVFINPSFPSKPMVRTVLGDIINLAENENIWIEYLK